MSKVNRVLIVAIVVVFTMVFTIRPLGALALAGLGAVDTEVEETESETEVVEASEETESLEVVEAEDIEETESETEVAPYSADDFYELSHVIQAEAGYTYWDMMIGVGSVVLNRVKSDSFPNTVYEVIHQPGQYSTVSYLASQVPTEEVLEVTDFLLRNGSQYPAEVVYQANFEQGSGTYLTLSTNYSTMFFCYQ